MPATVYLLQETTNVFDDDMAANRKRRRLLDNASLEATALDVDLRKSCTTRVVTKIVTTTVRRKCGICGREDEPGSGCGYGGFSPAPINEVT